jgi:protein-tyrosine-phosphatase
VAFVDEFQSVFGPTHMPKVLFVCVESSGRSQLAAELLRDRGAHVHVRSLGGNAATRIDAEVVRAADVVITIGCGDACPVHPRKHYENWDVDDAVLEQRVARLLRTLEFAHGEAAGATSPRIRI